MTLAQICILAIISIFLALMVLHQLQGRDIEADGTRIFIMIAACLVTLHIDQRLKK